MAAPMLCQQALPLSPCLFPFPHPHLSLAVFFSLHPRPESLFTGYVLGRGVGGGGGGGGGGEGTRKKSMRISCGGGIAVNNLNRAN